MIFSSPFPLSSTPHPSFHFGTSSLLCFLLLYLPISLHLCCPPFDISSHPCCVSLRAVSPSLSPALFPAQHLFSIFLHVKPWKKNYHPPLTLSLSSPPFYLCAIKHSVCELTESPFGLSHLCVLHLAVIQVVFLSPRTFPQKSFSTPHTTADILPTVLQPALTRHQTKPHSGLIYGGYSIPPWNNVCITMICEYMSWIWTVSYGSNEIFSHSRNTIALKDRIKSGMQLLPWFIGL